MTKSAGWQTHQVLALFRHASMSTTYKPALLKALLRTCAENQSGSVPVLRLGHHFVAMYWKQVVFYHLRQAATVSKESEVVRRIRNGAQERRIHRLADLSEKERAALDVSMAKVLAIDVLWRFHKSAPAAMPPLYRWSPGAAEIELAPGAGSFLTSNAPSLELIANYYWASYLEKCNRLAPRIIEKVARDGAIRTAVSRYLSILTELGDDGCFYCGRPFSEQNPATVDHLIPWTFILEDPVWDLVPACRRCNAAKSDWLPERRFLEQLVERNVRQAKVKFNGRASPLLAGGDLPGLYDAAVSVEWPGFWSPL
jgi:hypothetical protein